MVSDKFSERTRSADSRPHHTVAAMNDIVFRQMKHNPAGIPMLDLHVHLKGGLTLPQVLEQSRRDGIQYGIAVNCGKGFPVQDDAAAIDFCTSMRGQPVFVGMQAEGREWTSMFTFPAAAQFDYIFTDAMTWTDDHDRRMRLWIPDEVGNIADVESFMQTLVARTVAILEREPIDMFVNPTYLPDILAADYDKLWTEERMARVIDAALRNVVAIELNDLYQLPGAKFVRMAKTAGCKFTFGSNNTSIDNLGHCRYGLRMIEKCGLVADDFFVPGIAGPKAALRKRDTFRRA